ncbi:MAG: fructosamine kinase family protein, partial [Planctomycetota bacterium]
GGSADLTIEAFMLQLLAQRSELPVPGVVHAEPDLLVMEFIEHDGRRLEDGERGAADMLVALHGVTVDAYGLERDTLIGPLVQPNAWMQSWPRFYAERRLQIMGDLAERVGSLPGGVRGRLDAVCDRIEDLVGDAAPPSLVHGDIWSGNVLWDSGRVAAFIDPAVHYADAEVELAFIALFSCFGGAFWARYSELRPIREGFFETRRTLYQLQPLLIHAALFGGGYGVQVKQAIGRLGFQHGWSG